MGDQVPDIPSSPGRRHLSFRASGLTIEVEVTGGGGSRRLTGRLIPQQSGVVEIRTAEGMITAEADSLGRFSAGDVPSGPVSLRCRLGGEAGEAAVITGWVAL
jgi:hypothetical protein